MDERFSTRARSIGRDCFEPEVLLVSWHNCKWHVVISRNAARWSPLASKHTNSEPKCTCRNRPRGIAPDGRVMVLDARSSDRRPSLAFGPQ